VNNFSQMVEQVDRRIATKRARFVELLALMDDPDLAPYVAAYRNGHKPSESQVNKPFVSPPDFKDGHGIREAVRKLLSDETHPFFEMRQFTRDNVKNFLDDLYGKDTYSLKAVGDALRHLSTVSKNRAIKKFREGKGGKPTLYERI
jgi:hypothetical protein